MYLIHRFRLDRLAPLAGILVLLGSAGAQAQVAAPGQGEPVRLAQNGSPLGKQPAAQKEPALEEIIVTARRREENLQTVPIAVSVISPQVMRDNNVHTLTDIQSLVPSLTVTSGNVGSQEQANVTIRGQGWGSGGGTPAVSMYLNEVPIPTDIDGTLSGGPGLLFDLENVQVLKGPQGTLFGRNTLGGAILLQTARPTNEFGGHAQFTYGNYNDREIDAAINLPLISDVLLARLAINGQQRDGYTHVLSMPGFPNGLDLNNRDLLSFRGTLTFRPNDGIQNDTIVTHQLYSSHGSADFLTVVDPAGASLQKYPNLQALLAQQQAMGTRTLLPLASNEDGAGGSLLAVENITRVAITDKISIRNLFGYHKARLDYRQDLTGTPVPIFDVINDQPTINQTTDEAQILGKSFDDRLDWQAGLFYYNDESPYARLAVDVLQPTIPGDRHNVDQQRNSNLGSRAVYAQGTYDLSQFVSGLKLTGGGRYTSDSREQATISPNPGATAPFCGNPRVQCDFVTDYGSHSKATTYTVALDYQVTPGTLVYATSRSGYRGGGSTFASNGVNFPYGPEYVKDYEVGTKADWSVADIPVRTNADVYLQNYDKIQVNQLVPYPGEPGGLNLTENAAEARIWGAEFEALVRLTPDLEVGANYDYLSFKYTKFLQGVASAALIATQSANRVPHKYGVNARYRLPVPGSIGDLSARAYWAWQGQGGDFLGTTQLPAYGVLNLSFNWDHIVGGPLDASLFVNNATDKKYANGGIAFLGFTERTYGAPIMFGVRVNYRFGAEGKK
jgi:iron complex outermembrane receptor protein